MEDGLVLFRRWVMSQMFHSLNPCCNGRWSRTNKAVTKRDAYRSLNPCCNGRWSRTQLLQRTHQLGIES